MTAAMTLGRRKFLLTLAAAPARAAAPSQYITASPWDVPRPVPLPAGARVPFGWGALPVRETVTLRFPAAGSRLRITNAIDSREVKKVEARTAATRRPLGVFDMRYSYPLQPFEIVLERESARRAAAEGISLRLIEGAAPAWIFNAGAPPALLPHLLGPGNRRPIEEFHRRLRGMESVQPFGWMEGCVLDALGDLGAEQSLAAHLDLFLDGGSRLVYEDPRGVPADGRVYGIEGTLPFARIAKKRPAHPSIGAAVEFWLAHRDAEGCVIDGATTSTEGCYTVAYPMAVVARQRGDRELEALALLQLRLRKRRLAQPDTIHLRWHAEHGHTFRNWSRGVAWYLLGFARTLETLAGREDAGDLKEELARASQWALERQGRGGLWNCFVDEPATGEETSGSAGIAAAVARGAAAGLLPASVKPAARRTLAALERHLTPDGLLGGVAQSNRGGEELQRGGYRVISQMAMGLLGQLIAALQD